MVPLKKIAAGVGAAFALGYGASALAQIAPPPGAVADSLLLVNNFTLLSGNTAAGKSLVGLPIGTPGSGAPIEVGANIVKHSADTGATLTPGATDSDTVSVFFNPATLTTPNFSIASGVGGAGFVPYTTLPAGTINPNTYAAAASRTQGQSIVPILEGATVCGGVTFGECVAVHNQVNLKNNVEGTASGNSNLTAEFSITVTGAPQTLELAFDATSFLRAALAQSGLGNGANAGHSWVATVRRGGTLIMRWAPDGAAGGIGGDCAGAQTFSSCTEYADAFGLTDALGRLSQGDDVSSNNTSDGTPLTNGFEMELTLADGSYTFQIQHILSADASVNFVVPEPGTLALLGLGLFGLGLGARRGLSV